MKKLSVGLAVSLAVVLALGTVVAQQTRQTQTGKVVFDELVWDFENNTIVITGNPAQMDVQGMHDAQLQAPRITVDADAQLREIRGATASGPVTLNLLTAPDTNGARRRINARCTQRAVYNQSDATVTMVGNVVADIVTLPDTGAEAAHLESEQITVDLRASTLTAKPGSFEVTTEMEINGGQQ
ncbi:MAG: hypothetical protein GX131_03885 [candidate division WS1 bacterium]|jgi:hypothetical protein|nr:hypothetical protein [candidate division WS1 bacterium]